MFGLDGGGESLAGEGLEGGGQHTVVKKIPYWEIEGYCSVQTSSASSYFCYH